MNILYPLAGSSSRFFDAGYTVPKIMIDVAGRSMLSRATTSVSIHGRNIFVFQRDHDEQYDLSSFLHDLEPRAELVAIDEPTSGAAQTVLAAKELINNENPLIIVNSDQVIAWSSRNFLIESGSRNLDGCIVTFESNDPKYSYVKVNEDSQLVEEVAEKEVISNTATVGIYYWKHGSDYVKYAEQMIEKDSRVNGEYYVCPVYNEAILDGKKVGIYPVEEMYGLGTPEDLEAFLESGAL